MSRARSVRAAGFVGLADLRCLFLQALLVDLLEALVFPLDHGLRAKSGEQLLRFAAHTLFENALADAIADLGKGLALGCGAGLELEELIAGRGADRLGGLAHLQRLE